MATVRQFVVGALGCLGATAALAADPGPFPSPDIGNLVEFFREATGFYLGLDLGAAAYPASVEGSAADIAVRLADSHTGDFAWGFAFGWRFTPNFSSEAGYADLGNTSGVLAGSPGANGASGRFSLAIRGPTVAFVGTVPFDAWEGYVKVGYLFANADLALLGSEGTLASGADASRSTAAPFAAAGVVYRFDDRWSTQLEFRRYENVGYDGSNSADTININAATLGVGVRF
jgi:OmpA-like transmembrane domain